MTREAIVAAWDRPNGSVAYEVAFSGGLFEMTPAKASEGTRAAAVAGCVFAASHLSLAAPSILYFVPESERHAAYRARFGVADWLTFRHPSRVVGVANRPTHTIGIRADLDGHEAVNTAAHECFHLAGGDNEDAALAYGDWVAGVLGERPSSVHVSSEFPCDGAFAGFAGSGDLLLAPGANGERRVWRNFGSTERPTWRPHYSPCPVEV